jgi:hypothetical protein
MIAVENNTFRFSGTPTLHKKANKSKNRNVEGLKWRRKQIKNHFHCHDQRKEHKKATTALPGKENRRGEEKDYKRKL